MAKIIMVVLFIILIINLGSCTDPLNHGAIPLYNLTAVSPDNAYRVRLEEKKTEYSDQNLWPFKVFLEIGKNGRITLQDELLYSSDELDARFGKIASKEKWISEKILKLSSGRFNTSQQSDLVEVHNDSGKHLTYAFVTWNVSDPNPNERFLLLDIKPDEKITLQVTSNETDLSWIACSGRFEDGKKVSHTGRNFRIQGVCKPTSHYFVTIKEDKTLIESQECEPIN